MANFEEIEICDTCSCSCWMASGKCIVSFSVLPQYDLISTDQINSANDDVGDLIGEICFEQLCSAISTATVEATEWNAANVNDPKTVYDFLDAKWVAILTNRHFKRWYSNRVAYHWLEGSSVTQLKKVGLVIENNNDEQFKNQFRHAEEKQRARLAESAEGRANNSKFKFREYFWDCNKENYDCNPESCSDCSEDSNESDGAIDMIML